jgi:hypothetical protein
VQRDSTTAPGVERGDFGGIELDAHLHAALGDEDVDGHFSAS